MQVAPPRVAQVNVTPMIDLMLVLLMLFMIVQLLAPAIALPTSKSAVEQPKPGAVVLHINRNGTLEVGIEDELGAASGWPVAPGDLQAELERMYARRPLDRVLYVKADSSLPFGVINEALASARRAGVRVVATVTQRRGR